VTAPFGHTFARRVVVDACREIADRSVRAQLSMWLSLVSVSEQRFMPLDDD
jgi:hypothetical protein